MFGMSRPIYTPLGESLAPMVTPIQTLASAPATFPMQTVHWGIAGGAIREDDWES